MDGRKCSTTRFIREAHRRRQRLTSLHLPDVAAQVRRRFAQRVWPRDYSVRLGHPIRRFGEAEALADRALHASVHESAWRRGASSDKC